MVQHHHNVDSKHNLAAAFQEAKDHHNVAINLQIAKKAE